MRKRECDLTQCAPALYFVLGASIVVILFPCSSLPGIAFATIGDPLAAFGRWTQIGNSKRAGAVGALFMSMTCCLVTFVFDVPIIAACASVMAVTLTESLTSLWIDDNISIPVVGSAIIWATDHTCMT